MNRPDPADGLTYRASGVDIEKGNEVVRRIGAAVKATHGPQVLPGSHGGFAGLMALFGEGALSRERLPDPVLVSATDGVGTKLKVAFDTGVFDTIGIDLVAMCVNDLIVGGAIPLFFLDYVATAAIEPDQLEAVVRSVAEGCLQANCSLLGGETAEMPGFYSPGEFDVAGFAVGVVDRSRIIDGSQVREGDRVLGLPSSGLHSNGFSLVRKIVFDVAGLTVADEIPEVGPVGDTLLTPTRIYARAITSTVEATGDAIHAMAHITGGGLVENIPRVIPDGLGIELDRSSWTIPPIFRWLQQTGRVAPDEMDRVFNQGVGLVIVCDPTRTDAVKDALAAAGESTIYDLGRVTAQPGVAFIHS